MVNMLSRRILARPEPVTPYFGVRTNSLVFLVNALNHASNTALALLMLTPTPSAIRIGMYSSDFHPAFLPNSSFCPKAKKVLAEQVARTKRLKLRMYCPQLFSLKGLKTLKKV